MEFWSRCRSLASNLSKNPDEFVKFYKLEAKKAIKALDHKDFLGL